MLLQSKTTVSVLANGAALATGIVKEISGSEVANTLNGSGLSRAALSSLICSRIHLNFAKYTQGSPK
jgi:hypothetical protein